MTLPEPLALPPFPAPAATAPPALVANGIGLRPAAAADLPFLAELYADFRMPELSLFPWSPAQRQAFAADQFRLQHVHLVHHFPSADFWIVEIDQRATGRLYLDRQDPVWRLIDILLRADARGRGLGAALLGGLQAAARERGASGIDLHVAVTNTRAAAFYARHGFVDTAEDAAMQRRMIWHAA